MQLPSTSSLQRSRESPGHPASADGHDSRLVSQGSHPRSSGWRFWANQFRVLLTAAAYVLMQELRLSAAGTNCARAQAWTLRERFLKLGARVSEPVQAKDVELKERTYFNYRDETVETLNTSDISRALASRYACEPVSIGDQVFPVTILWQNRNALIHPDEILGTLDYSKPEYLSSSPTLSVTEYALARTLIESIYTAGPIKH